MVEKPKLDKAGKPYFGKFPQVLIKEGIWANWSPKTKAMYSVLVAHANWVTNVCCPIDDTIREEAGIKGDAPRLARKELSDSGWVKVWRKGWRWFYKINMFWESPGTYPCNKDKFRKKPRTYLRDEVTKRFVSSGKAVC